MRMSSAGLIRATLYVVPAFRRTKHGPAQAGHLSVPLSERQDHRHELPRLRRQGDVGRPINPLERDLSGVLIRKLLCRFFCPGCQRNIVSIVHVQSPSIEPRRHPGAAECDPQQPWAPRARRISEARVSQVSMLRPAGEGEPRRRVVNLQLGVGKEGPHSARTGALEPSTARLALTAVVAVRDDDHHRTAGRALNQRSRVQIGHLPSCRISFSVLLAHSTQSDRCGSGDRTSAPTCSGQSGRCAR